MKRWPTKPLGELVLPTEQRDPKEDPTEEFSYVDIASVDNDAKAIVATKRMVGADAPSRARKVIRTGDIIVSTVRPNLNAVALVPSSLDNEICSTGFSVLRPSPKVVGGYLFAFTRSPSFVDYLVAKTTGANYPAVNDGEVKAVPIPVPPLAEQERIVKLLDEANELRKLRAQADRRSAALIPALFHEMFGDSDSENWKERTFDDTEVMEIIDGDRGTNYPKKTDFRESGHCLFLNTSNVRKGGFDFSKCDFITHEKDSALRKGKLTRGDVILTTRGTLGNSAHYGNAVVHENVRINSGMVILRTNPALLLPEYLLAILNSDGFMSQVNTMTSGSAQPQLPINRLSHIKFVLPPLPLQKEFVQHVAEICELGDKQAASRLRLEALFQSLLHRAFHGDL